MASCYERYAVSLGAIRHISGSDRPYLLNGLVVQKKEEPRSNAAGLFLISMVGEDYKSST